MSSPLNSRTIERPAGESAGFPLTALFLLTALCCVLAGMVLQVVRAVVAKEIGLEAALIACVVGALVAMCLCAVLGLAQRQPIVGMFVGGPTGFVLGAIIGPLVLLPSDRLSSLMSTILVGSVVLVVFAVAMRWFASRASGDEGRT